MNRDEDDPMPSRVTIDRTVLQDPRLTPVGQENIASVHPRIRRPGETPGDRAEALSSRERPSTY